MNDPTATDIDIEEQFRWLRDQKAAGATWTELADRTDIAQGTISQLGAEKGYTGDARKYAEMIYRYRQTLTVQKQIEGEAPVIPPYFQTSTGDELMKLLTWAQRGRIVYAALGAGMGKTTAAEHFAACYSNVFLTTMAPSSAGVNNMQIEVLAAMGEANASGTPQKLSRRICGRVKNIPNALLIIDEAQHLSEKSVEEIRSWHDKTGLGIALFGNESIRQRLEGGQRAAAYAQLFSRISLNITRHVPLAADADALAEAWHISGKAEQRFIRKIAMVPGGLRGATMALELASMIAVYENKAVALGHLQDAWAQLSSRAVTA
ncbi:MAG: AAA family ATPase [Sphingomonadaceae bacterium]|nr:AAA family ATPase [Sphingomonadaceae bacterium]